LIPVKMKIMDGMITAGIHAPSVNFTMTTAMATAKVVSAPTPVKKALIGHCFSLIRTSRTNMPDWLMVKPREHANCVQRDQCVDDSTERNDETRGSDTQKDHAVAEHETVATIGKLSWQETVLCNDRRQLVESLHTPCSQQESKCRTSQIG